MQFINKSILFAGFLFFLISCSNKKEKLPDGILKKEAMVAVMIDIQLADAAVNLSNYGQTNFPNDKEKLFQSIYLKHAINKKIFDASFAYYTAHPEEFEKIYDDVITGLSSKQAELAK